MSFLLTADEVVRIQAAWKQLTIRGLNAEAYDWFEANMSDLFRTAEAAASLQAKLDESKTEHAKAVAELIRVAAERGINQAERDFARQERDAVMVGFVELKRRFAQLEREYDELNIICNTASKFAIENKEKVHELEAMIAEDEWEVESWNIDRMVCPECGVEEGTPHSPDCKRGQAVANHRARTAQSEKGE